MAQTDVIVIGAGLAGLSAARTLVEAGKSVVVLEARDRVGGRTEGGELEGAPVELGGTWLGEGHTEMYDLVETLGLATFPTWNDAGQLVLNLGGKKSALANTKGATPKLNPIALADLAQGLLRYERLARSIDPAKPWSHKKAEELDGQTWESWIRRNLRTATGRSYFRTMAEALYSADSSDLSLLHTLFYTRSNGDLETLASTDRGAQKDRVVGGSVLVAQRLAESLDVRLNSPVARIEQDDKGVTVTTRGNKAFAASQVIVAIPPTLSGRIDYAPLLPAWRDQLTQRTPAGTVIKCFAAYPTPFWRNDGWNGQAISDEGPVKITFDVSPPDAEVGVLLGFVEGSEARRWQRLSDEERRRQVLASFARYFGPEAARPTSYLEKDWSAEEFTRGCYGAHFGPGTWTSYGDILREPVGRIHWAGAEYAVEWNGYMEGAVRSGRATAAEVLRTDGPAEVRTKQRVLEMKR
jgi:monoamine oxidase